MGLHLLLFQCTKLNSERAWGESPVIAIVSSLDEKNWPISTKAGLGEVLKCSMPESPPAKEQSEGNVFMQISTSNLNLGAHFSLLAGERRCSHARTRSPKTKVSGNRFMHFLDAADNSRVTFVFGGSKLNASSRAHNLLPPDRASEGEAIHADFSTPWPFARHFWLWLGKSPPSLPSLSPLFFTHNRICTSTLF